MVKKRRGRSAACEFRIAVEDSKTIWMAADAPSKTSSANAYGAA